MWSAIITGALGIVAGFLWLIDKLLVFIFKCLRTYPILIEFVWNRNKYKALLKEGDYETLKKKA